MRALLSAAVAVLLAVPAASAQPEVFSPKDGGFTVKFPGKPKESTQTAKSAIGDLKVFTATFATADGQVYMVSHTDFPAAAVKPDTRGSLYDGIREGLKGKDGKVVSEKDIEFGTDKLPGKEVLIDKGKNQTRFRVVLRDHRLFQVAVLGPAEFVTGKEATAFLESFELK